MYTLINCTPIYFSQIILNNCISLFYFTSFEPVKSVLLINVNQVHFRQELHPLTKYVSVLIVIINSRYTIYFSNKSIELILARQGIAVDSAVPALILFVTINYNKRVNPIKIFYQNIIQK